MRTSHHSPTGGLSFATKKDSGYTSSRTSLEPSECGDEPQQHSYQQQLQNGSMLSMTSSASSSSNTLVDSANLASAAVAAVGSGADGAVRIAISPFSSSAAAAVTTAKSSPQSIGTPPTSRVTLISQQLEDTYGSVTSTMTNNVGIRRQAAVTVTPPPNANAARPLFLENPTHTPVIDYDSNGSEEKYGKAINRAPSSDSGKSSIELNSPTSDEPRGGDPDAFRTKPLAEWSVEDVGFWLANLRLDEQYARTFSARGINGAQLARFDRAKFTQIGVTRVAHRQAMEQSLKEFRNVK